MTWGEITPFCPDCRRCGSLARGISLPLSGEGSTCPAPLVPLRNLRETSRSAVRPGRPRRGPRTTRSVAAPACVVPHGGRSRVSVVSPRRFRSSRPHPVPPGRLLPRRSPAVSRAVVLALLTVICSVLGAGPAVAQPAIPVPRPGGGAVPVPAVPVPAAPAPAQGNPADAGDRGRHRRRRPRPRPRRRRTRRVPRRSCGRCSTRPRRSPSSGTPLRTTSPRGVPSWAPCATRSTRPGPRPTPPAARRSSTASRSTPSRCRRSRAAGSTRSTRCWPARHRRTTSTRCRRWR